MVRVIQVGTRSGLFALALVALTRSAAADYGDTGPLPVTVAQNQPAGGATSARVVVPQGKGPFPLLVLSHGFSASGDNQIGWASHFASYGFVAVVPSFPNTFTPNHTVNAGIVKQLVALYTNPNTTSAAQGKVDAAHVGLEGHSAGGLATALAASNAIQAIVLFDPVDANDLGKTASPTICSPTLALFAGPSACNNQAGWKSFVGTQSGPLLTANVVASNHCDGENAPRALCGPFCTNQGADAGRQKVYARWATAFFLAKLAGDAAAQTALAGIASDTGLSGSASQNGTPCALPIVDAGAEGGVADSGTTTDSGVPGKDGGVVPGKDAGGIVDAGGTPGNDGGDGFTDPGTSGCSCDAAGQGSRGALGAWALVLVGLVAWARRRR
jgi:MYXO-CTERM domain-containing protein